MRHRSAMKINFDIPYENKGAWKVPEGYFDELPDRVMNRIAQTSQSPEADAEHVSQLAEGGTEQRHARIFTLPRRVVGYAAAACVAAAVVLTVAFNGSFSKTAETQSMTAKHETAVTSDGDTYSDEYRQDCYEYAMVDADDLYDYIIED